MIIEVLMPSLSPTMKNGTIVKWYKKEGDKVKSGEVIADIETDKAIMEFEYIEDDGILAKILVQEKTKGISVNELIALIVTEEEKDLKLLEGYNKTLSKEQDSHSSKGIDSSDDSTLLNHNVNSKVTDKKIFITPLAKKIALNENIDINSIVGTGPYNRIVKKDVLNKIDKKDLNTQCSSIPSSNASCEGVFSELSNMRKLIAKRLVESKNNVPHFYLTIDCNVDKLLELRVNINKNNRNNNITINDLIVKAVSLSIKEFPRINVSFIDNKILHHSSIDVSIAVSLEDGLITPIIKNADGKSLSSLSIEIKDLVKRAKGLGLKPNEFQGGSMTISNLGMFGIKNFSAIINPPQSCILAVGASEKRAVVGTDSTLRVSNIMTLTLSVDHRVVDGELASNFFNCLKNYIENPLLILL